MGKAGLILSGGFLMALVIAGTAGLQGAAGKIDNCKSTEAGIRQLWNATVWDHQLHRVRDEAEHTRVVADLARSAEKLCQESRDRKPRQLPPELQQLAR